MTSGVIFDLEGTLVRLPIDYEALYENISKELKIPEVRPITETLMMSDSKSQEKIFRLWERAELKALSGMSVNQEGLSIYRRHSGKLLALVTMQGMTVVEEILARLQLSFRVVITREDEIDRMKQIKMAIDALGLEPRKVLVVGDRETDEVAAEKLNCEFIKVRT